MRNALGILRISVKLGCQHLITACVNYLEAVPWDDSEEDEILRTVPQLGPEAFPILARVEPVHHAGVKTVFISALRFATSPSPLMMVHLKSCAKQQTGYMLSKDHEDAPLLIASDQVKSEVSECTKGLFSRFHDLLDSCSDPDKAAKISLVQSYVSDLLWFFKIVRKLGIMTLSYFIVSWLDVSDKVVKFFRAEKQSEETNLRLIEVAAKVLEAIVKGMVILPTSLRVHALKVWLPFIRWAKPLIDAVGPEAELELNLNSQLWVSLESTFVTLTLSMPSADQTQILTDWLLHGKPVEYPDLTQAFDTWCNRTKVSKRRLMPLNDKEEGDSTQSDCWISWNDKEEGSATQSDCSTSSNDMEEGSDVSMPLNDMEECASTPSDGSNDNEDAK